MMYRTKFLLLTLLILQVVLMATSKICSYAYHSTKTNECKLCGKCEIGEGIEKNCGHDENGDMIPGKSPCRKCSKDEYQMKFWSTTVCMPCNKCYGKRFKIACSATADAVCEDCPKGFYEFSSKCHRCSRCCHGSNGMKHVRKCLEDGMAVSHSCSPNLSCSRSGTRSQKFKSSLAKLMAEISNRNMRLKADILESKRRLLNRKRLTEKLAQETNRLLEKQRAALKDTKARIEANLARLKKSMSLKKG